MAVTQLARAAAVHARTEVTAPAVLGRQAAVVASRGHRRARPRAGRPGGARPSTAGESGGGGVRGKSRAGSGRARTGVGSARGAWPGRGPAMVSAGAGARDAGAVRSSDGSRGGEERGMLTVAVGGMAAGSTEVGEVRRGGGRGGDPATAGSRQRSSGEVAPMNGDGGEVLQAVAMRRWRRARWAAGRR